MITLEELLHVLKVNDVERTFSKCYCLFNDICTCVSKGLAGTDSDDFVSSFFLREPSGLFISKMLVIFVVLNHIRVHRPGRYLDMSFLRVFRTRDTFSGTHLLVYQIKETYWRLEKNGYEIYIM
jgi:hypothetical protein